MSYTVKCVRHPARKAVIWGGHVIKGERTPIAGWCSERCANAGSRGFSGLWRTDMGEVRSLEQLAKSRQSQVMGRRS